MTLQDFIIAGGTVILIIGLLPTIYSPYKPAIHSSFTYALVLTVFAMTFGSLGLYLSAGLTALNALLWYVIAGQTRGKQ